MTPAPGRLASQVVARQRLDSAGFSGNAVERVTLADGRRLVRKHVSPEWDWLSRATGDCGRALSMWERGLFDRIPPAVDHATVAVEADGDGWSVYMHDVSGALFPASRRLDRAEVRRVLAAMVALHDAFRGEPLPDLCGLEDRYRLLSPGTARRERERGNSVGDLITRGWDVFSEHVPEDVAAVILALAERPALLAEQLGRCEPTLVHGDVRLTNLGFAADSVVLIDWGERTGPAPAAVDVASFIGFDAVRLDVSRDQVVADFRELSGDRLDDTALHLSLLGGLVQLGSHFGLAMTFAEDEAGRAWARDEFAWWTRRAEEALAIWSPA